MNTNEKQSTTSRPDPSPSRQKTLIALGLLALIAVFVAGLKVRGLLTDDVPQTESAPTAPPAETQIEVPAPTGYEVDLSGCTGAWYNTEETGWAMEFPKCAQIKAIYR